MPRFRSNLTAAGLILASVTLSVAAQAQTATTKPAAPAASPTPSAPAAPAATVTPAAVPPGLIGAWGGDSSCGSDVAVFRADGTVLNADAPSGTPPLAFTVSGDSITMSDGKQSGTFAFALSDQAVAWSNGVSMVLKERCADQTPFAAALNTAANATPGADAIPAGPLPDQLSALAGQPLPYQGSTVQIHAVQSLTPHKAIYTDITALPDPQAISGDARLYYRIFPTSQAASAYVSLASNEPTSFLREPHGAGFFSTDSAVDQGPQDGKAAPVTINCLRFHPRHYEKIVVSCFAALPGSKIVAGAERSFLLPEGKALNPKDMGQAADLTDTLALTGAAIAKLRLFLAAHPQP